MIDSIRKSDSIKNKRFEGLSALMTANRLTGSPPPGHSGYRLLFRLAARFVGKKKEGEEGGWSIIPG